MTPGDNSRNRERDDVMTPDEEASDLDRMAWDLMNDIVRQVIVPLKTATPDDLPGLQQAAALFDARLRFITKAMAERDRTRWS